ncbi:MAG: hypothetical protein BWX73_02005 [Lentisphaerae bacterium ADurb.Bin082]|nr:MAG: hypothetical protein BWX73_02005 [Lentisphaerae bacterium ADurb.Bin082]
MQDLTSAQGLDGRLPYGSLRPGLQAHIPTYFSLTKLPPLALLMKKFFSRHWPEVLLVLAVFLVFAPSLLFPLLPHWDDSSSILLNQSLAFSRENIWHYAVNGFQGLYTPLTMYSLMLDNALFGQCYACFHATSIALHCGAALLLVKILQHLGIRRGIAILAALLWAVHPQRIESLVWLTERKDVLSGFLAMSAVYVLMKTHDRQGSYLSATVLAILSIAANPATVFLPLVFLVYVLAKGDLAQSWRKLILPTACYGFYALLALAISQRLAFGNPTVLPPPIRFLEIATHNVLFYISNTVLPLNLNPVYPLVDFHDWWIIPVFVAFFAVVLAWSHWAVRDARWLLGALLGFGAAWLAMFAPNGNGVIFNPVDYADRYSYAAAAVLVAFTAFLFDRIIHRRPATAKAILALVVLLAGFAAVRFSQYLPLWKDSKLLFTHAINSLPEGVTPNDKAIHNVAIISLDENDADALERSALAMLKLSLGELGKDSRDTVRHRQFRENNGTLLLTAAKIMQQKDDEALRLTEALYMRNSAYLQGEMFDPQATMPRLLNLLTELFCRNNRRDEAARLRAEFPNPLHQEHIHPSISNSLARLSFLLGDFQTALALWQQLEKYPGNQNYTRERIRETREAIAAQTPTAHSVGAAGMDVNAPSDFIARVDGANPLPSSITADDARPFHVRAVLMAILLCLSLLALAFAAVAPTHFPKAWRFAVNVLAEHWPTLALVAAVFLCFSPTLAFKTIKHWDDATYISNNPNLHFTWENIKLYALNGFLGLHTPLTMYSLMLDKALYGHNHFVGFHLTAIVLQSVAALFLNLILRHLGVRKTIACLAAFLWAVHPQRLESVAWLAERKDVLSGCLGLAAVYVFMKTHDRRGRYFLAAALTILSIAAKPATILLPVVFLAYVFYRGDLKQTWRRLLPPALAYLSYFGVVLTTTQRLAHGDPPAIAPLPRFVELISHNVIFYISSTVFPVHLNPVYPLVDFHDWWIIPPFILLAVGVYALARWAGLDRRWLLGSVLGFGAAWWAMFAPNGNGVTFNPTDYADRYSYAAAAVLVAFLAFLIDRALSKRPSGTKFFACLTAAYALFLAWQFRQYLPVWKSDRALFTYAIENVKPGVYPNDKAIQTLCVVCLDANDADTLEGASLLMLERARGRFGKEARDGELTQAARENFGIMFLFCAKAMQGKDIEALRLARAIYDRHQTYTNLLMYDPNVTFPRYMNLLTEVFCRNNCVEEAGVLFAEFADPLNRGYEHPDIPNNLARLALLRQDYQAARILWEGLAASWFNNAYVQARQQELSAIIAALPPEQAAQAMAPPPPPLSEAERGAGLAEPKKKEATPTELRSYYRKTAACALLVVACLVYMAAMTAVDMLRQRREQRLECA